MLGQPYKDECDVFIYGTKAAISARILAQDSNPDVDLALLLVTRDHNRYLPLSSIVEIGDPLFGAGYPNRGSGHFFDTVTAEYEGFAATPEGGVHKFKDALIQPGYSGGPLINRRTMRTIGVITETRGYSAAVGGFAIPTEIIWQTFAKPLEDADYKRERVPVGWHLLNADPSSVNQATIYNPHLPYECTSYIGRQETINDAKQIIKKQWHKNAFVIDGLGGIGKTATAIKIARDLYRENYVTHPPTLVDLHGFTLDREPVEAQAALSTILSFFSADPPSHTTIESLRARLQSILEHFRTCIILDNAKSYEQIRNIIIPNCQCIFIITARASFGTLPGISLPPLSVNDGGLLAREIANAQTPERLSRVQGEELARQCGGVPLAIVVAASKLARSPVLPTGQYVERLVAEQDKYEEFPEVMATLALSLRDYTQEHKRRWSNLAVFVGHFTDRAAARIWDCAVYEARKTLHDFVVDRLLFYKQDADAFYAHDLQRSLARHLLSQTGFAFECQQRHAQYYMEHLAALDAELRLGNAVSALTRFDIEAENVTVAQRWSAANSETPEARGMSVGFAICGAEILAVRLNPEQRVQWFESGLRACLSTQVDTTAEEVLISINLASALLDAGKINKAESILCAIRAKDDENSSVIANNLGLVAMEKGNLTDAREAFGAATKRGVRAGNPRRVAYAQLNLGNCDIEMGRYRDAIEAFGQAKIKFESVGDMNGYGESVDSIARALILIGEYKEASKQALNGIKVARLLQNNKLLGSLRLNQSVANLFMGNIKAAERAAREAAQYNLREHNIYAHLVLAVAELSKRRKEAAMRHAHYVVQRADEYLPNNAAGRSVGSARSIACFVLSAITQKSELGTKKERPSLYENDGLDRIASKLRDYVVSLPDT